MPTPKLYETFFKEFLKKFIENDDDNEQFGIVDIETKAKKVDAANQQTNKFRFTTFSGFYFSWQFFSFLFFFVFGGMKQLKYEIKEFETKLYKSVKRQVKE